MDRSEIEIGQIDHYYGHAHIAGVWLKNGTLKLGDRLHIKGHTTDLETTVTSMQIEHQDVREAMPGAHVGIPVSDKVRAHDRVFVIQQ